MVLATCIIAAQLAGAQLAPEAQSPPPMQASAIDNGSVVIEPPVQTFEDDQVTAPAPDLPPAPRPAETDLAPSADSSTPDQISATAVPSDAPQQSDIVVTGRASAAPGDPLQALNAESYKAVQAVDEAVTGPIALAYRKTLPNPVRSGLRNFLNNLVEPVVALNYLLQLKPGKSAETIGRFAIYTTVGVAGFVDVAKKRPFKLPRRRNGFANTLGYYGVGPGPFLYLPLMGPTTVRDLFGRIADVSLLPVAVGQPFSDPAFTIPTTAVRLIDERAEADEGMRKLLDGVKNPYAKVREDYLQGRQAEIDALHGNRKTDRVPLLPAATGRDRSQRQ